MSSRSFLVRAQRLALATVAAASLAGCSSDDTTAPGVARITKDRTSIDLGRYTATVGKVPAETLTVVNSGDGSTGVLSVELLPTATTAGFTRSSGTTGSCGGHDLAPLSRCTIIVTLGGPSSGPQSGTLIVLAGTASTPLFTVPVTGTIRSAYSVLFPGSGQGTVTASPASAALACSGAGCSSPGTGAQCAGPCTLFFETPSVTLVASETAGSTFGGFFASAAANAPRAPCAEASGRSCTIALAAVNSVAVRFGTP